MSDVNIADPAFRRSTITWDPESGSWSGIWRCQSCGRYIATLSNVKAGALSAAPCRSRTCTGLVNRLGFETYHAEARLG